MQTAVFCKIYLPISRSQFSEVRCRIGSYVYMKTDVACTSREMKRSRRPLPGAYCSISRNPRYLSISPIESSSVSSREDGVPLPRPTPCKPICPYPRSTQKYQQPKRSFRSTFVLPKHTQGRTGLHQAAVKGDVEEVESLISAGAHPNVQDAHLQV